ncbi:MAG: DUF1571 domain-containing protein [Bacteroidetes bacterium]|nr:DUF1571 domain-containing protein [Bacteroidota bacterium]
MIKLIIFAFFFINYHLVYTQKADTNAFDILNKTIKSTRAIKTMSFTMTKIERIDGEMLKQISLNKMIRKPLSVYLRQEYPVDGMEVLYKEGEKVLINPNGFPWINLRLSPDGNLARVNQHHTILESGYDHVINILDHLMSKYNHDVGSMVFIEKDSTWESHAVWKIKLQNAYYKVNDYVMQENETVMQVARRDMLSEYWLVEQNEILKSCNDESPGATIKRPNDYAPSMELYIDKIRFIPLVMKVYDNIGIYEHYTYSGVTIDPVFKDIEFEKDYEEYGF